MTAVAAPVGVSSASASVSSVPSAVLSVASSAALAIAAAVLTVASALAVLARSVIFVEFSSRVFNLLEIRLPLSRSFSWSKFTTFFCKLVHFT